MSWTNSHAHGDDQSHARIILAVGIYQTQPSANKKLPWAYTDVRGSATVRTANCTTNTWAFSENLTTLMPCLYSIEVSAENATITANQEFTILDNRTYNY